MRFEWTRMPRAPRMPPRRAWQVPTDSIQRAGASVEPAVVGGRQECRIENIARFRLGLKRMDERDLIDSLGKPRAVDTAQAVGAHFRGDDVVPDCHPQPLELDLFLPQVLALE